MSEPVVLLRTSERGGTYHYTALSGPDFTSRSDIHPPFLEPRLGYPCPSKIVGHSNGVFCLRTDDYDGDYVVWNPLTNEYKFLPPSTLPRPHGSKVGCVRGSSAFAFDATSRDYKVLHLIHNYYDDRYGTTFSGPKLEPYELYSLKKNSWKEIRHPGMYHFFRKPVSVGGVSYCVEGNGSGEIVVAFDFEAEEFYSLPLPETGKKDVGYYRKQGLWDYDGSLSTIVYPAIGDEETCELWVLTDGSWEKVVSDMSEDKSAATDMKFTHLTPMQFWKKKLLFLKNSSGKLLSFDLATKELKDLGKCSYTGADLFAYVPNAVPLAGTLR